MELLKPGYYQGKILDYGVRKTQAGDPAPTIAFTVTNPQDKSEHKVYWQGSWKPGKAIEFAMEALLVCGLSSSSKLLHLAEGRQSGVLDTSLIFDLEIEIETDQKDPTKKYNRVKWINASGSSKFKNAITVQEFAPLFNERGLAAELSRIAQEKGYELSGSMVRNNAVNPDIPF